MKPASLLMVLFCFMAPGFVRAQSDSDVRMAEADLATVFNYIQYDDMLSSAGQIPYDQVASLRQAGFEVVINLAPVSESANALEGFLVVQEGLTFLNIPVSFREPSLQDLTVFFDMMKVNEGRRTFVHCAANMRATVFTYLYRTLVQGVDEASARADMETIWDPNGSPAWAALIEKAQAEFGAGR